VAMPRKLVTVTVLPSPFEDEDPSQVEERMARMELWLHDQGYTYTGPSSMYRLTVPEINRLYGAWSEEQEQVREETGAGPGPQVRKCDLETAQEFAENRGLT